jgi:plasmid stability protein
MEAAMGNLLVRDVSDDLVAQLKARARANGRSAEAEHREILRRALSDDDGARFEELAAQLRALTAGRRQTPAEDLLREMRGER